MRALTNAKNKTVPAREPLPIVRRKGNKRISSMSKIRKIRAKTKKRIENGSRPSFKVENPHSKGDRNSRSWFLFLEISSPITKTKAATKAVIKLNSSHIKIISCQSTSSTTS